jgi:hypothetical protein
MSFEGGAYKISILLSNLKTNISTNILFEITKFQKIIILNRIENAKVHSILPTRSQRNAFQIKNAEQIQNKSLAIFLRGKCEI